MIASFILHSTNFEIKAFVQNARIEETKESSRFAVHEEKKTSKESRNFDLDIQLKATNIVYYSN